MKLLAFKLQRVLSKYSFMRVIIIGYFMLFMFGANAQWSLAGKQNSTNSKSDTKYSLNVGTQLGTAFNGGFFHNNYFSPAATINTKGPVAVTVGVGAAYTQLKSLLLNNSSENNQESAIGATSLFAYAHGLYKVSPKIHLNASLLMEETMMNSPSTPAMQQRIKEMQVGVNYQLAPSVTINAQFGYSNRPFYSSFSGFRGLGYGVNSMNSPLYW